MSSFSSPPGKVEWRVVPGTSPKSRKPAPGRTSLGGGTPAQAAELPLRDRFPKVNMPFPGREWPEYSAVRQPAPRLERRNHPISGGHGHEKNIPRGVVYPAAGSPSGRREFGCVLDTSPARVEAAESRFPRRQWAAFGGFRAPGPGRPGSNLGRVYGSTPPAFRLAREASIHRRASGARPASTRDFGVLPGKLVSWNCCANAFRSIDERIPKIRSPGTRSRSRRTPRPAARPVPGMPCGR